MTERLDELYDALTGVPALLTKLGKRSRHMDFKTLCGLSACNAGILRRQIGAIRSDFDEVEDAPVQLDDLPRIQRG
jgi:hypothetical protein